MKGPKPQRHATHSRVAFCALALSIGSISGITGCSESNGPASQELPGTLGIPVFGNISVSIPSGAATLSTNAYGQNPLVILDGSRVTWTNNDALPHTVTSTGVPPVFDSGLMNTGTSFTRLFTSLGTFPYFCSIHPNMVGSVAVIEGDFEGILSGDQEIPPVVTNASGTADVEPEEDGTELRVRLTFSGLSSPIAAMHIHQGAAGVNGPIIFNIPGPFVSPLEREISAASVQLRPEVGVNSFADAINAMIRGETYVNIHTAQNPGGEIRAQLVFETDEDDGEDSN